jgi:hypothetical protein
MKCDHWLGDGIYFFEDEIHAYDWILKQFNKYVQPIKEYRQDVSKLAEHLFQNYTILKSQIIVDENRIWDLDNPENLLEFKQICNELYEEKIKYSKKFKDYEISEGVFINIIFREKEFEEFAKNIDMIIHTFKFRAPESHYRSYINHIPQKQICVKNTNIIDNKSIDYHDCKSFSKCYPLLCHAYPHIY